MTEKITKEFVQDFIKKLGETCRDTYEKLRKVYGEGCMRFMSASNILKLDVTVLKAMSKHEDL